MQYNRIQIRNWRELATPFYGDAVVFDIFRCSTTVQTLLSNKKRETILVSRSLDHLKTLCHDFSIFSELKTSLRCALRFDNSPAEAIQFHQMSDCLVSTTSGTPAMFAAKNFQNVYIGSLANFSALVRLLTNNNERTGNDGQITLLPAADPSGNHVEDELVAEQIAIALDGYATDSEFVRACADQARAKIEASGRVEHLIGKLNTGADDVQICLDIDRYDFVPKVDFSPWCNTPGLARVYRS